MMPEFVNRERFADNVHWSKLIEDLTQPGRLQLINFEIPVLRLDPHQFVAHTTTDEQRTAAGLVNGLGQRNNFFGKLNHKRLAATDEHRSSQDQKELSVFIRG